MDLGAEKKASFRNAFLADITVQVEKRLQDRKKLAAEKKAWFARKDPDWLQEWWDTLSPSSITRLFDKQKPSRKRRFDDLFVTHGDEHGGHLLDRALKGDDMQILMRHLLRFGRDEVGGLEYLYCQYRKMIAPREFLEPAKRWWYRSRDAHTKITLEGEEATIYGIPAPRDFFNDVWLDAFSTEARLLESKKRRNYIRLLHQGLGKHAFAHVVTSVRHYMYGDEDRKAINEESRVQQLLSEMKPLHRQYFLRKNQGRCFIDWP